VCCRFNITWGKKERLCTSYKYVGTWTEIVVRFVQNSWSDWGKPWKSFDRKCGNYCRLLRRIALTLAVRTGVGRRIYRPHQKHKAIHTIYHLPNFTVNGFTLRSTAVHLQSVTFIPRANRRQKLTKNSVNSHTQEPNSLQHNIFFNWNTSDSGYGFIACLGSGAQGQCYSPE
jgi:hypothetical protein